MKRECSQFRDLIADSVSGILAAEQAKQLAEHLDRCAECQAYAEALKREDQLLARLAESVKATMPDRREDLLQAMSRRPAIEAQRSMWRTIMKSRVSQLAAAAVIVVAVIFVIEHSGGSIDGAGVAWADVRDAFLRQRWVHVKYDNGDEQWRNLQTGDTYFKQWNGRCVTIDYARNIRRVYHPEYGWHIEEDRPAVYRDDVIPTWQPKTAWESVIGPWEQLAEHGGAGDWEAEGHADRSGGAYMIRFDCYFNDPAGRRLLIRQIWADSKTRLPLTVWERLQLADRERQKRESITGTFDFPQTGPTSIYDLGVPRDLPVTKSYDKVPVPSVEEVVKAGKAAWQRLPARYLALQWDNTRASEIEVIWRDGKRIRQNHYFNLMDPSYHLRLPATAREVLAWAQTQIPISTYMFEGTRMYTRHYTHPGVQSTSDEARVMRENSDLLMPNSAKPLDEQWFYTRLNVASLERIADAPEELSAYVGLRTSEGDIRRDYYVDPAHDYICIRNIRWKQRAGQWEEEREYEYSDFKRLPEGQWYAGKYVVVTYPDPQRGTAGGGANWEIDVQLLQEADLPADTFNGDKLLEGAKIETY